MDKYIKESDLFKRILNVDFKHDYDGCIKFCQSIPAADVQEVQHGCWDDSKVAFHRVCSKCGAVVRQDVSLVYLLECMEKVGALNYCPNCGAKMDEVERNEN